MFYLFVCFVATESQNILIWKVWGWLEFFFVLPTIKIKIDRNIYMEKFLQRTMFRNFLFGGVFPLWSACVGLTSASLLVKGFKGLKRVPIANRFFFFFIIPNISPGTAEAGKKKFTSDLHWYLNKLCGKYVVWSFYRNLLIMLECACTIWHNVSSLREQGVWSCYH